MIIARLFCINPEVESRTSKWFAPDTNLTLASLGTYHWLTKTPSLIWTCNVKTFKHHPSSDPPQHPVPSLVLDIWVVGTGIGLHSLFHHVFRKIYMNKFPSATDVCNSGSHWSLLADLFKEPCRAFFEWYMVNASHSCSTLGAWFNLDIGLTPLISAKITT